MTTEPLSASLPLVTAMDIGARVNPLPAAKPVTDTSAVEPGAGAKSIARESSPIDNRVATGNAARVLQRSGLQTGRYLAEEKVLTGRAKLFEELATRAEQGTVRRDEVEKTLSELPLISNRAAACLWTAQGTAWRARINDAFGRLADALPEATITRPLSDAELALPAAEQQAIIASCRAALGFERSVVAINEALFARDTNAVETLAKAALAKFGDRGYGLIPWLKDLASGGARTLGPTVVIDDAYIDALPQG